jgi:hypothetical protein
VGNEPNTASEATQDDPPDGEKAVSAVQAIAAPLAAAETGSRITTSPPCEVSSTTSSQGLEETAAPLPPVPPAADDDKKVHQLAGTTATAPRLVEGVIADSNNEKVLFEEEEDDEIDDVEPALSAPETLETAAPVAVTASSQVFRPDLLEASDASISGETDRVLDPPQMISSNPHPDPVSEVDHSAASEAASAVEGGSLEAVALVNSDLISISVVDRTAGPAADQATEEGGEGGAATEQKQFRKHHATTLDEVEDVSVTMVERKKRRPSSSPDRTTEKRRREEEDAVMIDSRLMRVEADAAAVTDHHPEPIVTISKVSAVKAAAAAAPAASPGPTDATARRTPVSSPSAVQQPNPLQPPAAATSYSMFAQRMRGGGAQHPPPRPGGLMMMGHHPPPRGFLMRGGFRGGGLRGAGALPSLQPRPPLGGPMSLPPAGGFPSAAAGPVAEQLNRVAGRLADYMKHSLEDLFRDLSSQVGLQRHYCLFETRSCGSGIRCLFYPLVPGWVKIRIRIPDV